MQWWTWLGIGFLSAIAVFSIILVIVNRISRRRGILAIDLLRAEQKRMQIDLEAEKVSKKAVERELIRLAEKYKQINTWYTRRKTEIKKGVRNEYEALVENPDLLDRKLDGLLGLSDTSGSAGDPERLVEGSEAREIKEGS